MLSSGQRTVLPPHTRTSSRGRRRDDDLVGMMPDLELVEFGGARSFTVRSHGYPYRTVRWHFHPEYEIHLIVETTGRAFVGDYLGYFAPGNLVMTGPNVPHNWISDTEPGAVIACRCIFVQFTAEYINSCLEMFPELEDVWSLLQESQRGVEFSEATADRVRPVIFALQHAVGIERIELFLKLLRFLSEGGDRRLLASAAYKAAPADYMENTFNHVLAHVRANYTELLRESELAALCGCSRETFSRQFSRHTGLTFVQYVNGLRIHLACEMLTSTRVKITDVCYQTGFNNLSNFNRQFLQQKGVSPTVFRNCHRLNLACAVEVEHRIA
jgi:AraC-like DNA-binding protein